MRHLVNSVLALVLFGSALWAVDDPKEKSKSDKPSAAEKAYQTLLMRAMDALFTKVDVYTSGNDLLLTNLTGHPCVVLPNGFRKEGKKETPTSIRFTGSLYGETELLAIAQAYQEATGFHLQSPPQ